MRLGRTLLQVGYLREEILLAISLAVFSFREILLLLPIILFLLEWPSLLVCSLTFKFN